MRPEAVQNTTTVGSYSRITYFICVAVLLLETAPTLISAAMFQPRVVQLLEGTQCPTSCGDLFGKLEDAPLGGKGRVQRVQVQERGEPKSGTALAYEMATSALAHACMFLQSAYGEKSCRMEWEFLNRTMIFEPSQAMTAPGPCVCTDVEMVVITLTNRDKHKLPVETTCGYAHIDGIAKTFNEPCEPVDGRLPPRNYEELSICVQDSACHIVDDSLQMSIMRDPRPVSVSAYFHTLREYPEQVRGISVDAYAIDFVVTACKWVTIRHTLFSDILADKASTFWYQDAIGNSKGWHNQFFDFVGLHLPASVVTTAVAVAAGQVSDVTVKAFPHKGIDVHEGGEEAMVERSYRDEVSTTTLVRMDDAIRAWLPPVLLERFGVD